MNNPCMIYIKKESSNLIKTQCKSLILYPPIKSNDATLAFSKYNNTHQHNSSNPIKIHKYSNI